MLKILSIEKLLFVGLLIVTAFVLYFAPVYIQLLFFVCLLVVFYYTQYDHFWLAFFAAVIFETGGFFVRDLILGFGDVPLSLILMVAITFSLKSLKQEYKIIYLFRKQYFIWLVYLVFLILVGTLIYGLKDEGRSGLRHYYFLGIMLTTIPAIYTIPRYFRNLNFLVRFSRLVFLTVIFNLLGQILHLSLGNPLYLIFRPDLNLFGEGILDVDFTSVLIRPVWGHWICFLGLLLALFFLFKKSHLFQKPYLYIIIFICYISIFISATRGWFLAFSFIIVLTPIVLGTRKNVIRVFSYIIVLASIFLLLYSTSSSFKSQSMLVLERYKTLELLIEGDVTAGGTSTRLTDRSKDVMNEFRDSPVFGKGFSSIAFKTNDSHVGNQNMLMEGGIIGFIVNIYVWASIIIMTMRIHFTQKRNPVYNQELLVIIIALMGLVIIHSSSTAILGYLVLSSHPDLIIFIPIVLGIINCILIDYKDFSSWKQPKLHQEI